MEEKLAVDGSAAQTGVEFVVVLLPGSKIIGEEIGKRDDLSRCVFGKRIGDRFPAIAAAQQTVPHCGVRIIPKCRARIEEQQTGSSGSAGLDEFASVH